VTLSLPVWLLTTTARPAPWSRPRRWRERQHESVVTRIDAAPTPQTSKQCRANCPPLWMVFTAFVIVHENPLITIVLFDSGEVYHLT